MQNRQSIILFLAWVLSRTNAETSDTVDTDTVIKLWIIYIELGYIIKRFRYRNVLLSTDSFTRMSAAYHSKNSVRLWDNKSFNTTPLQMYIHMT